MTIEHEKGNGNSRTHLAPCLIAAAMLLVALAPSNPSGYYVLLRWVVCPVAVFLAYRAWTRRSPGWGVPPIVVAVLFNPLLPIWSTREFWGPVDTMSAIALAGYAVVRLPIRAQESPPGSPTSVLSIPPEHAPKEIVDPPPPTLAAAQAAIATAMPRQVPDDGDVHTPGSGTGPDSPSAINALDVTPTVGEHLAELIHNAAPIVGRASRESLIEFESPLAALGLDAGGTFTWSREVGAPRLSPVGAAALALTVRFAARVNPCPVEAVADQDQPPDGMVLMTRAGVVLVDTFARGNKAYLLVGDEPLSRYATMADIVERTNARHTALVKYGPPLPDRVNDVVYPTRSCLYHAVRRAMVFQISCEDCI